VGLNFAVLANGQDITELIRDRLIRLVVHDVHGELSDSVEIELDNRDLRVETLTTGAELSVAIGYGDELVDKGLYQVDETEEPLETDTILIHAKAAKTKASFKAPRNATYDNVTIGALVQLVAERHGFTPSVSTQLASIQYEHINQEGESDMNMLSRLARDHDALSKPVDNRLLFKTKDESKTVSGKTIPPIVISDPTESRGKVTVTERSNYRSVVAYWYDDEVAEQKKCIAGQGEPIFTIRRHYTDGNKCQAAADAKLRALQRGIKTMTISRPLMPDAIAEGALTIANHKPIANGLWVIEEVTHTIASGQFAVSDFVLHLPKT
jgi:phage protein D